MTRRLEWLVVLAILGAATVLRVYALGTLPPGLHGDEAIAGLQAQRIVEEGWIDVYSATPAPNGSPTAYFYGAVLPVAAVDDPVLGVRLVAALGGVLSILALFLVLRPAFGFATAAIAAAALALMDWHLHFSRVGLPHSLWPLAVIGAAWAIARALRSGTTRSWTLAGAVSACGIYVYNAHLLFLAIAVLPLLLGLVRDRGRSWRRAGAFAAAAAVVALPMLTHALFAGTAFLGRFGNTAVSRSEEWQTREGTERLTFVVERYGRLWREICCDPTLDTIDGSGLTRLVAPPALALAIAGVAVALRRRTEPLVTLGIMVLLMMPFAAVTTVGAAARRTYAMAPFVAMFAAIGTIALLQALRPLRHGRLAGALVGVVLLAISAHGVSEYFRVSRSAPEQRWVFAHELTGASLYLRDLPPDTRVLFLSERWSVDYETRQYLAPDIDGEDRSEEFGRLDLTVAEDEQPVFVLLGRYRRLLDELRRLYPRGTAVGTASDPFVAYHVRR